MKKRLLALALCLVMMTSLLPITAAAVDNPSIEEMRSWVDGIKNGGTYCKEASFTIKSGYSVDDVWVDKDMNLGDMVKIDPVAGQYKISGYSGRIKVLIDFKDVEQHLSIGIIINDDHTDNDADHSCDVCNATVHTWQFTQTNSTLTATCQNGDTAPVSVSLVADSVTLPNSPFNARLEGWEAFKKEVPTAHYEKLVYQFNGPSGWTDVEPTAANAKAGEYQVGVRIMGLPTKENVAYSLADGANGVDDGDADLYLKYTAVDPAITAQTGDNRPIEIMMACALVFSALAAAAFIVDNKRKYSR